MHPWVGLSDDVRLGAVARWVTPQLVTEALDDCGVRDKKPVASGARCKSAGVVPGFMIRSGDGADSLGLIIWLGRGDGAWPELARWFEQRAAQVLQEPQSV
jgi:hypothetical protein